LSTYERRPSGLGNVISDALILTSSHWEKEWWGGVCPFAHTLLKLTYSFRRL